MRRLLVPSALTAALLACSPDASQQSSDTGAPAPPATEVTATSPPAPGSSAAAACEDAGDTLISSATWTTAEGGVSLSVVPTAALRACGGVLARLDDPPVGWVEVVALAGPEAQTPTMRAQYACHLLFARTKDAWALEPWRPEVDAERMQASGCNP